MRSIVRYSDLLLAASLQDYLRAHENDDVQKLLLKEKEIRGIPARYIAQQIAGRQKIKHKLPSWWARTDLLYPSTLNLEQASSEATAKYKSAMLALITPTHKRAVDLTGGFGIDTFFLSKSVERFDYVEKDQQLFEIARENFKTLKAANIECQLTSAEDFIKGSNERFDFIYIDPSRRKGSQKVFRLRDCEPEITKLQSTIFAKTDVVVVKASPLLDIQQGTTELTNVAEVCVVALNNECKELLFLMRRGFEGEAIVRAVDIDDMGSVLREIAFKRSDEANAVARFSAPEKFIYEPSASILKAGAFKWISKMFHTSKLAPSTHLYTSEKRVEFPGRTFRVIDVVTLDKKLKNRFENGYANILTRNYPLSVEEIKKKTGLKEGGDQYLICTQDQKNKLVLIAERLNAEPAEDAMGRKD
jgi:16S rRNA G966 N2-methylase RsmD